MAYVFKNAEGHIIGFSRYRCDDAQEWVDEDEPTLWVSPKEELEQLDKENYISQRRLREFIMLTTEALKRISEGEKINISVIPGVSQVFETEAKAEKLRKKL